MGHPPCLPACPVVLFSTWRVLQTCMNGSFNIRTRQGSSGRVGHKCANRRYDVKGCRNIMYSGA
eukprot:5802042-Prymnesium_polylepis.1